MNKADDPSKLVMGTTVMSRDKIKFIDPPTLQEALDMNIEGAVNVVTPDGSTKRVPRAVDEPRACFVNRRL